MLLFEIIFLWSSRGCTLNLEKLQGCSNLMSWYKFIVWQQSSNPRYSPHQILDILHNRKEDHTIFMWKLLSWSLGDHFACSFPLSLTWVLCLLKFWFSYISSYIYDLKQLVLVSTKEEGKEKWSEKTEAILEAVKQKWEII